MTRKEEIQEMAKTTASHITSDKDMQVAFADALRRGAQWADRTMIDKACDWLYAHLYTRRDEQSPANHFVCSEQEMLTQTEFVEQFRKAMI